MTKPGLAFAIAVAVAGITASVVVHHRERANLRQAAEASRQQVEQIAKLSAENERLSNTVAATAASPLTPDQRGELLRLRGQIEPLRQAARERAQLEAANRQLRTALAAPEQQLAEARLAPNFWPKDQLAFAGYTDPESALKTLLWAISKRDLNAFLACWPGDSDGQPRDKVEAEASPVLKMLSDSLAPSVGFHVLDKKTKPPQNVILNLSFDGEGRARKFELTRVGNEWRIADMLRPGEEEP
jgi:hypothetical protein